MANRWARLVWNIVQATLFRLSPIPLFAWRRALLRLFGARLGEQAHIYPSVEIWAPWNLKMGHYSSLAPRVVVYNRALVTLGDNVIVSQYSYLCAATHDYTLPERPLVAKPITVGPGAWVCAGVFVGPGVTIGEMAVIGARAVVVENQPAWMVCAGHPCKPIKKRIMRSSGAPSSHS